MRHDTVCMRSWSRSLDSMTYMFHLSGKQQASADLLLTGFKTDSESCDDDIDSASLPQEWMLPCHSVVLSIHSGFFRALERNAEVTSHEKSECGKRIVQVHFTEAAAEKMLEYCYGVLGDISMLSLAELCEVAVMSNMQDTPGLFAQLAGIFKTHTR